MLPVSGLEQNPQQQEQEQEQQHQTVIPHPTDPGLISIPLQPSIASPMDPPPTDYHTPLAGLACIMDAVAAEIGDPPLRPTAPRPASVTAWLQNCLQAYFHRFHERWPVVHRPIFDEKTDDALLVGSVLMIGSWMHDHEAVVESVLCIHDRLMVHLLTKLVSSPTSHSRHKAKQVVLLNVALAFEIGVSGKVGTSTPLL
jgi:hypothetical protein